MDRFYSQKTTAPFSQFPAKSLYKKNLTLDLWRVHTIICNCLATSLVIYKIHINFNATSVRKTAQFSPKHKVGRYRRNDTITSPRKKFKTDTDPGKQSNTVLYFGAQRFWCALASVRIRIQHFTSIWIRIQGHGVTVRMPSQWRWNASIFNFSFK